MRSKKPTLPEFVLIAAVSAAISLSACSQEHTDVTVKTLLDNYPKLVTEVTWCARRQNAKKIQGCQAAKNAQFLLKHPSLLSDTTKPEPWAGKSTNFFKSVLDLPTLHSELRSANQDKGAFASHPALPIYRCVYKYPSQRKGAQKTTIEVFKILRINATQRIRRSNQNAVALFPSDATPHSVLTALLSLVEPKQTAHLKYNRNVTGDAFRELAEQVSALDCRKLSYREVIARIKIIDDQINAVPKDAKNAVEQETNWCVAQEYARNINFLIAPTRTCSNLNEVSPFIL